MKIINNQLDEYIHTSNELFFNFWHLYKIYLGDETAQSALSDRVCWFKFSRMLNFRPIDANSKSNPTEPPEFVEVTSTKYPGKRCTLLYKYQETCAKRIKTMKVYSDDIWVISFPKCGTSWTIEMVWLINNNMNFQEARSKDADEERFLFLE